MRNSLGPYRVAKPRDSQSGHHKPQTHILPFLGVLVTLCYDSDLSDVVCILSMTGQGKQQAEGRLWPPPCFVIMFYGTRPLHHSQLLGPRQDTMPRCQGPQTSYMEAPPAPAEEYSKEADFGAQSLVKSTIPRSHREEWPADL